MRLEWEYSDKESFKVIQHTEVVISEWGWMNEDRRASLADRQATVVNRQPQTKKESWSVARSLVIGDHEGMQDLRLSVIIHIDTLTI